MEKFIDIDKFVETYSEREQNRHAVVRGEGRRINRRRRKLSRKSAMTGIFIDNDEWKQWIVCSFKDEEMRFQVGPYGPMGSIQRRIWMHDEWSDWMDAEHFGA